MSQKCIELGCDLDATHILVDKNHEIIGINDGTEELYCEKHAFEDDRACCSCCKGTADVEYEDKDGNSIELEPTYPNDELDNVSCCSWHP